MFVVTKAGLKRAHNLFSRLTLALGKDPNFLCSFCTDRKPKKEQVVLCPNPHTDKVCNACCLKRMSDNKAKKFVCPICRWVLE
jgi:hypothetical protein